MAPCSWLMIPFALLLASSGGAVSPQVWYISSASDVEKGDIEGLSVGDDGGLTLAPTLEDLGETEELFIWSLEEDRRGRILAGTGNQGRLFVKEGTEAPRLFFDSPQTQLQSLALDTQGNVYAGSAPDGIIYKIGPDGNGNVFCHTGETYLWDLRFNREGYLYAATGPRGIVLKIDSDGRIVNKVLDSPDAHVMCLASDGRNGFYAGTDGSGLVYHINAQDQARLLFSATEREIHTIAIGPDGRLYAGAVAGRRDQSPSPSSSSSASSSSSPEREPGGVVYRLEPSGAATKLWTAPYPLILSIAPYDSTRMLIGVGPRGVLYWLSTEGRAQRVADTGESQPAVLFKRTNGDVLIGMGNSGKIKQIGQKPGLRGIFTSDVQDGALVSQWGRVDVRGDIPPGAELRLETRTGNKKDPFQDWSLWQPLGGANRDMVQSPAGQYLQVRATLSRTEQSRSPMLYGVSITGQQVNVRPEISGARVSRYRGPSTPSRSEQQEDQSSEQRPSRTPPTPAAIKRTLMMLRWGASDPNDDKLVYDLYYRRVGETQWKTLVQDLTRTYFVWDTEGAPEGLTVVKIEASDRPSNPWTTAMTAERVSDPFEIDYTGPTIANLRATVRPDGAVLITGAGTDAVGTICEGNYSIDSGEWLVFFPEDGIFDSPQESLNFVTEILDPGEHTIVVKLTDASENVGTASVVVTVPRP